MGRRRTRLTTQVKNYIKDVKELRRMRTLRSTRLGDIEKKYQSLVDRAGIIQDMAINKWLDGGYTNKEGSLFITCSQDPDFGDKCLEVIENSIDDEIEDWWTGEDS